MNQPIEFPQRRKPTAFSSVLSLVALTVCLLWPTSARAEKLFLSFPDAIGEQSSFLPGNPPPKIDVAEMSLTFETTTGEYSIVVRTTVAAPFVNLFFVNVNLWNPDAGTFFSDTANVFDFPSPTTVLVLTGTSQALLSWASGQRVATSTLAGLGNPPNVTLFRSGVTDRPAFGEDTIAPTTVATLVRQPVDEAIELLSVAVEVLVFDGLLDENHAEPLDAKLSAALRSSQRLNAHATCGQLKAFTNQVRAFIRNGTLPADAGQRLFDSAQEVRIQLGCAGS